jgi:hypothetical protein
LPISMLTKASAVPPLKSGRTSSAFLPTVIGG